MVDLGSDPDILCVLEFQDFSYLADLLHLIEGKDEVETGDELVGDGTAPENAGIEVARALEAAQQVACAHGNTKLSSCYCSRRCCADRLTG